MPSRALCRDASLSTVKGSRRGLGDWRLYHADGTYDLSAVASAARDPEAAGGAWSGVRAFGGVIKTGDNARLGMIWILQVPGRKRAEC